MHSVIRVLTVLAMAAASVAEGRAELPATWRGAYDFLVQEVCVDPNGAVIIGASPLDAPPRCPQRRKIGLGERLPYQKRDWPGVEDRHVRPDGYQQTASVPIRTALGLAVAQSWDFGDDVRAFDRHDPGDGGQIAFFSERSVAFGVTEDGGAGLQFFIGPGCGVLDGWIIVDDSFAAVPSGEVVARITRRSQACPGRLGYAYTRWRVRPVSYRTRARGEVGRVSLDTLVSEHFGGRDAAGAGHLERFYFTRALGSTRWERWENLAVQSGQEPRDRARALTQSGRCDAGIGSPGLEWAMVDCREWTQIVPPADPAGDPPGVWTDRLRQDGRTRGLFPP